MVQLKAWLQKLENALIIVTSTIMVFATFAQVLNRNFFKLGIGWFEELAVYCMIWMALLGTEIGLRDGSQAAITALTDKLHGKAKAILELLVKAIVTIFTTILTYHSFQMVVSQITTGQTSAALHLPMAIPYAALLISFAAMTLVQGTSLIYLIFHFMQNSQTAQDSKGGIAT